MPAFDEFIRRNQEFASTGDLSRLTAMPDNRVFVVTCLDPRVEPAGFLGIRTGDAIVLRNPGGRITDAVTTDIALISYMGEFMGVEGPPMEIAVVHHTGCGMGFLADERFRSGFAARSGIPDAELAGRAVTDPSATVRQDVARLLSSPLITRRVVVSGHVLDLGSGLVTTVAPAAAPATAASEKTA
ncbi:MAG TPA: carbonic anhydrase [Trebonia sp.]